VDEYDKTALREQLSEAGVHVGEFSMRYGAEGLGPSLYITDPEDNVVELKGPPIQPEQVNTN